MVIAGFLYLCCHLSLCLCLTLFLCLSLPLYSLPSAFVYPNFFLVLADFCLHWTKETVQCPRKLVVIRSSLNSRSLIARGRPSIKQ